MVWGSPCQDLSIAKKDRKGLDGKRSGLFWEAVRIWKEVKPKYWLMENVASMSKEAKDIISKELGVEPIMINSALVSAQQRKRLYWSNIPVTQPQDLNIYLKDIIESGDVDKLKSYCIDASYYKGTNLKTYLEKAKRQVVFERPNRIGEFNSGGQGDRVYSIDGKSVSLSANGGGRGAKTGLYYTDSVIRKLTPIECERLQTFPDDYTSGISNTQRYKCLGNSFTVKVIEHILKNIF
jgi:DNA (cytosine-5)-methyltransferase 3A